MKWFAGLPSCHPILNGVCGVRLQARTGWTKRTSTTVDSPSQVGSFRQLGTSLSRGGFNVTLPSLTLWHHHSLQAGRHADAGLTARAIHIRTVGGVLPRRGMP